jgi:hypothetical protein
MEINFFVLVVIIVLALYFGFVFGAMSKAGGTPSRLVHRYQMFNFSLCKTMQRSIRGYVGHVRSVYLPKDIPSATWTDDGPMLHYFN